MRPFDRLEVLEAHIMSADAAIAFDTQTANGRKEKSSLPPFIHSSIPKKRIRTETGTTFHISKRLN
jgi:hypothetical protein